MTYGDGLTSQNLSHLYQYHLAHSKLATVTAVTPPGRFGSLTLSQDHQVTGFSEKPSDPNHRINGGYFVLHPDVLDYIPNDLTTWEDEPLQQLSSQGQLVAFKHDGFWHPMDTLRDKKYLENLFLSGKAPWIHN